LGGFSGDGGLQHGLQVDNADFGGVGADRPAASRHSENDDRHGGQGCYEPHFSILSDLILTIAFGFKR
jgi:hypothetical protein